MKTCNSCGHWFTGEVHAYASNAGSCTLQPTWANTGPKHFCGQFVSRSGETPAVDNSQDLWARERNGRAVAQQERAIKAEKALKELRAQLREARKNAT